jgi:hypothetical protein
VSASWNRGAEALPIVAEDVEPAAVQRLRIDAVADEHVEVAVAVDVTERDDALAADVDAVDEAAGAQHVAGIGPLIEAEVVG